MPGPPEAAVEYLDRAGAVTTAGFALAWALSASLTLTTDGVVVAFVTAGDAWSLTIVGSGAAAALWTTSFQHSLTGLAADRHPTA